MRSEVQVLLDPPSILRDDLGALAQLGERLICIQEVIGSIPIGSTNRCVRKTSAVRSSNTEVQCSTVQLDVVAFFEGDFDIVYREKHQYRLVLPE